jgi:hypothetical protein
LSGCSRIDFRKVGIKAKQINPNQIKSNQIKHKLIIKHQTIWLTIVDLFFLIRLYRLDGLKWGRAVEEEVLVLVVALLLRP